jgi:hypothetical protein
MGAIAKPPFSNLQIEFLKLYESGVSDEDLRKINSLIVDYFANKMQDNADEEWDKKGYTNELMDQLLNSDLRK